MSEAVAQDNPHLYFEIQHLNRYGRDSLAALAEATSRIRDLITEGDEAGFVDLMKKGRQYFAMRG